MQHQSFYCEVTQPLLERTELQGRKKSGCSYNSHENNVCTHLQIISKTLDKLSASYDNIMHLGDFNVESEEAKMSEFLNMYSLKNLVSQKQRCQIFTNLHWQSWNNTIRNKNLSCCSIENTKISAMINLEAINNMEHDIF